MIKYRILQIKDIAGTDYAFRGYHPEKFNIEDYEIRYEGEFAETGYSDIKICDIIFHVFNVRRPEGFTGHSLSVSDLIHIESDGTCRLYYCDIVGWTLIKEVRS